MARRRADNLRSPRELSACGHARTYRRADNSGGASGTMCAVTQFSLFGAEAASPGDDVGYWLATSEPADQIHRVAGAQLARLGVAAVSLAQRGGPGWRVTSARRLRRLVELLGTPPPGGEPDWPEPASPS